MALALHHSQAKGTDRVVLIGIANHDGDGGSWPSHATLSVYANVDVRNVRRSIENLEAAGEVYVHTGDGGTHRTPEWQRTNRYEILLRCPENCDGSTKHVMYCLRCRKPLGADEKRAREDVHRTPKGKEQCSPPGTKPRFEGGAESPTEPSLNHPSPRERIKKAIPNVTCAGTRGRPHSFVAGRCGWCGIREDEL